MKMEIDWFRAEEGIRIMREAGVNETRIACVVSSISVAAVQAERRRVLTRLKSDLPEYQTVDEIMKLMAERVPFKAP